MSSVTEGHSNQQYLCEDSAHYLESRGVVQLVGEGAAEALQPLVITCLAGVSENPLLTYILSEQGHIFADLFVIQDARVSADGTLHKAPSHDDSCSLLLECSRSLLEQITEKLAPLCKERGVLIKDISEKWRVFAELPDQSTFKEVQPYIKYPDLECIWVGVFCGQEMPMRAPNGVMNGTGLVMPCVWVFYPVPTLFRKSR